MGDGETEIFKIMWLITGSITMGIVFMGNTLLNTFLGGAENTFSCGIDYDDGKSGTISDLDE